MLLEAASYTATATLITRNTPELAAPIAVLWWVTLLATPLLLVFAIPFNEYTRVFNFGVSRKLTQPPNPLPRPPVLTRVAIDRYVLPGGGLSIFLHSCIATVFALSLILRYLLIHCSSALTSAIVTSTALAISAFAVMCSRAPGPHWTNAIGLFLLLPAAAAVHVAYMYEREKRMQAPSKSAELEAGAGPTPPMPAASPSETSALMDAKRAGAAGADAAQSGGSSSGGCVIA